MDERPGDRKHNGRTANQQQLTGSGYNYKAHTPQARFGPRQVSEESREARPAPKFGKPVSGNCLSERFSSLTSGVTRRHPGCRRLADIAFQHQAVALSSKRPKGLCRAFWHPAFHHVCCAGGTTTSQHFTAKSARHRLHPSSQASLSVRKRSWPVLYRPPSCHHSRDAQEDLETVDAHGVRRGRGL